MTDDTAGIKKLSTILRTASGKLRGLGHNIDHNNFGYIFGILIFQPI
jgi:hypothetical protein